VAASKNNEGRGEVMEGTVAHVVASAADWREHSCQGQPWQLGSAAHSRWFWFQRAGPSPSMPDPGGVTSVRCWWLLC